jgi:lysophospholipase L1-like esterase
MEGARAAFSLVGLTILVLSGAGSTSGGPRPATDPKATANQPSASPSPLNFRPAVSFTSPPSSVAAAPGVATLEVPSAGGNFTVPYIQTSPDLNFAVDFNGPRDRSIVDVVLDQGRPGQKSQRLHGPTLTGTFRGLDFGEHTLDARLYVPEEGVPEEVALKQPPLAQSHLESIARGDVVAALGDSVTEGLQGGPYPAGELLQLKSFPDWTVARAALQPIDPTLVSADGRNFPQPGATLHPASRPGFEVALGRMLADVRHHPVLVLNQGVGGIGADRYVGVSTGDAFARTLASTHPNGWIVNLGANDIRYQRSAQDYGTSLRVLAENLERGGAAVGDIHVACPSYRDGATVSLEQTYLPVVDDVRRSMHLGPGPDFFHPYRDRPGLRDDWVHPSAEGYAAMAQMWAEALGGRASTCAS